MIICSSGQVICDNQEVGLDYHKTQGSALTLIVKVEYARWWNMGIDLLSGISAFALSKILCFSQPTAGQSAKRAKKGV